MTVNYLDFEQIAAIGLNAIFVTIRADRADRPFVLHPSFPDHA